MNVDTKKMQETIIAAMNEMAKTRTCPLNGNDCQKRCAWNIAGECAVASIAGSLAEPDRQPLDELTAAVNRVAAEVKRKVY